MPYSTTWEKRGLLTKWVGKCTGSEILQMQQKAHANPRYDEIHYSIHDFTDCESYEWLSHDEMNYSAALDYAASNTNAEIKVAIVDFKGSVRDICEMYVSAKMSPYPVRYFSSLEEARVWAQ